MTTPKVTPKVTPAEQEIFDRLNEGYELWGQWTSRTGSPNARAIYAWWFRGRAPGEINLPIKRTAALNRMKRDGLIICIETTSYRWQRWEIAPEYRKGTDMDKSTFVNTALALHQRTPDVEAVQDYIESLDENRRADARKRALERILSGMSHTDLMVYLQDHYPRRTRITEQG